MTDLFKEIELPILQWRDQIKSAWMFRNLQGTWFQGCLLFTHSLGQLFKPFIGGFANGVARNEVWGCILIFLA